jgi:Phycobilisome degradation protein nblA
MNQPIKLSLEQEFHLRSFTDEIKKMSREQALEYLVDFYRQMMLKETQYKALLSKAWFGDIASRYCDQDNNTT